jgi:cytoskeletal protein CcmA (bactofilin family)
MWKREEASKPVVPVPVADITATGVGGARTVGRAGDRDVVKIGKAVVIKGELSGSEDLTVDGQVDGQIELKQSVLTIGQNGRIRAEILAKGVVVLGEVVGNIKASDMVSIRDTGAVEGDIISPRIAIAEGARFRGKIDMQRGAKPKGEQQPGSEAKSQEQPQQQATMAAKAPASATAGQ